MKHANDENIYFSNEVVLKYGEKYCEISEAREVFEEELCKFLKIIHECDQLELKRKKWQWGWDCCDDDAEKESYEDFLKKKPFMLHKSSRVYLFKYTEADEDYYAACGFGYDMNNGKSEIVFFTSIEPTEGADTGHYEKIAEKKSFKPAVRYDGVQRLVGSSTIPLRDLTLKKAISAVKELLAAF